MSHFILQALGLEGEGQSPNPTPTSSFVSFFGKLVWFQTLCGACFGTDFVHFFMNLSWQWPSPVGISDTLAVGRIASRLIKFEQPEEPPQTFAAVMSRPYLSNPELYEANRNHRIRRPSVGPSSGAFFP